MRKGNIINYIINAAVFIILEVAALVILRNNAPLQDTWMTKSGKAITGGLGGWFKDIADYFSLREKNTELINENFALRNRIYSLESFIDDSLRIADIGKGGKAGNYRFTSAEILKISNNSQHNYMIIGKGRRDGIVKGSGLITEKGVVGIIDAVGERFSYALSFKNNKMSVSSRIGRYGATGPLVWDGVSSNGAILKEIPHHMEVNPGDTIFTSGHSSIFPADIPLGIIKTSRLTNGSTFDISVTLFEDFSALRYITIVENLSKDEIKTLEEK